MMCVWSFSARGGEEAQVASCVVAYVSAAGGHMKRTEMGKP